MTDPTRKRHSPPDFDPPFRERLRDLMLWRRDVRRFQTGAVDDAVIAELIGLACRAPSVGNSQPWRFVRVDDLARRCAVAASFARANAVAAAGYPSETQAAYVRLKLAGLREAPVHLAVFCDDGATEGHGLGRQTMPEMLRYSVVCAVHTLWLAARAQGLGLGWVSILEPDVVTKALDVPPAWTLVAYLCLGWPEEQRDDPELVRVGWQDPAADAAAIHRR
jgi:5,6-dimethylbenzimidazole synthase